MTAWTVKEFRRTCTDSAPGVRPPAPRLSVSVALTHMAISRRSAPTHHSISPLLQLHTRDTRYTVTDKHSNKIPELFSTSAPRNPLSILCAHIASRHTCAPVVAHHRHTQTRHFSVQHSPWSSSCHQKAPRSWHVHVPLSEVGSLQSHARGGVNARRASAISE
jgi:hypothetical protein